MIVITRQLVSIDDEVSARELALSWKNGNKSDVLNKLKGDHPGLTALLIVQCSQDRLLTVEDCNEITTSLIEARRELLLASE